MKYYFVFDMIHGMTYKTEKVEGTLEEANGELLGYKRSMLCHTLTITNKLNVFVLNTAHLLAVCLVKEQ